MRIYSIEKKTIGRRHVWINTSVGSHGRLYVRKDGVNEAIHNF